jgi:hypothetical protein
MHLFHWLLAALAGWTAVGVLGSVLAWTQHDRPRLLRGLAWMAALWALYLASLLAVGHWQSQRIIVPGQPECFGEVCFTVTGVQTVGEFKGRGGGQLVQVSVRVTNRGAKPASATGISAYLVDTRHRIWPQTPGVGGIALAVELAPGHSAISQPVFRVETAPGNPQLALVLTRGRHGWGWLTIADTDSLLHQPTLLQLPPANSEAENSDNTNPPDLPPPATPKVTR